METAREDWDSEIDERNHSVDTLQYYTMSAYSHEGVVQRANVSERRSASGLHERKEEDLKDAIFTEGGSGIFNWVKLKFNQCMFDMWHNGTHYGLLNTLILWDYGRGFMMGLHRALQNPNNTLSKNTNSQHSHAVLPSITRIRSCTSPIPSLCSLSPLSSSTNSTSSINPLELFTAVDLELASLSVHKQSNDSSSSFPSLGKISIPCSPLCSTDNCIPGWFSCTPMEATKEHTGRSSHCETGTESSVPKPSWATVPKKWDPQDKAVIEKLGLNKIVQICREVDEPLVLEAIANYNPTTRKTIIQGLTIELNAETVAQAFDIDRDTSKKENPLSDVALSKYLDETDEELKERRKKKQGITCKLLKGAKAYKFIVEAVAMKGTSTYISETMLAKFLAKELRGSYVDIAKEITDTALLQMKNVKEKGQKLIKCGHVWIGLYKQVATLATKAATIHLDAPKPPSPIKITQQPAESSGDKKRKADAAALELISKKPKPTAVAIEPIKTSAGDNWKTLLEIKRLEKLNKEKFYFPHKLLGSIP